MSIPRMTFVFLLLALLMTGAPVLAQESTPPRTRATPVRVLLENGSFAAGAHVLAVASPDPDVAQARPFELVSARCDERGIAYLELAEERLWAAWATLDRDKLRFASTMDETVVPGRGLVLRLQPFPVPFVRFVGVDAWRALAEGPLRVQFTIEGRYGVPLPAELPEGDSPIVRLPSLPLGNFFPTLLDGKGRQLDFTYFSPAFHEGDADVEPLYEREYPLKRVMLAHPVVHEYRVLGPDAEPVPHARIQLEYGLPIGTRTLLDADAEGRLRWPMPFRPQNVRAHYAMTALVWAPGLAPMQAELAVTEEPPGAPRLFPLAAGERSVTLGKDSLPADLDPQAPVYLNARWTGAKDELLVPAPFELRRSPDGGLLLPALGNPALTAQLWVATPRGMAPLYSGSALGLANAKEGLPPLPPARMLHVRREGGGRPLGVRVVLMHDAVEGLATSGVFERALGSDGDAALPLPPGSWLLYVYSPRDGDAVRTLEVDADRPAVPIEVELARFEMLRGQVLGADDKPVPGAEVTVHLQSLSARDKRILPLLQERSIAGVTDERGEFRIPVTSLATRLHVWCSHEVEGQYFTSSESVDWTGKGREKVTLRLGG